MEDIGRNRSGLTVADLEFLVSTAAPESNDRARLKKILEADDDFRNAFIDDENTIRKVISDKEAFLKISPRLYFEILLRKVRKELGAASPTLERGGTHKVVVLDAGKGVDLLSRAPVLFSLRA